MADSLPSPPAERTDTAEMNLDALDGGASPSSSIASDEIDADGDFEAPAPSNAPTTTAGGSAEPSNAGPSRSTRQTTWASGSNSNARRQRGRKGGEGGGGGKASWRGAGGLMGPGGLEGAGPQEKLLDQEYPRSALASLPAMLTAQTFPTRSCRGRK